MPSRAELKTSAKQQLKGKWGTGVLAVLIIAALNVVAGLFLQLSHVIGEIIWLVYFVLVLSVVMVSTFKLFLDVSRNKEVKAGGVFNGFKFFGRSMALYWSLILFVIIWSIPYIVFYLLTLFFIFPGAATGSMALLIPGIIFAVLAFAGLVLVVIAKYRFGQAIYIGLDNPEMPAMQCVKESDRIMKGHKGKLFVLELSFIGWAILAAIPFGIGLLWLIPYIATTNANFYQALIGKENK